MKKIFSFVIITCVLVLGVGCSIDVKSAEPEILEVENPIEESVENIQIKDEQTVVLVVEEETVDLVIEDEIIVEEDIIVEEELVEEETYKVIGAGYFYSEPFDDIYPQITEDENGMFIRIVNGTADKYVISAVEKEVEDFNTPLVGDFVITIVVENDRADITEQTANDLFTNIIYYLYEVI